MAKERSDEGEGEDPITRGERDLLEPRLGAVEGDELELPEGYAPPEGVDISKLLVGGITSQEDDELPEELRGKSKKEIADLLKEQSKKGASPDPALAEGLTKLSEAILKSRKEEGGTGPEVQKPGESEEDFWKRASTALFDEKEIKQTLFAGVDKHPRIARLAVQNMENQKEILQLRHPKVWESYGEEIETEAKGLLKQYGPDGEIYKAAFQNVRARHVDEIVGGPKDQKIAELEARIQELEGKGTGPNGNRRPRTVTGGSGLTTGATGTRRAIRVTPELREKAMQKGMTVEAYLGIE